MHILYPCDPFNKKIPDEYYREEYDAVMDAGLSTYLFSFEDFEMGIFNTRPPILTNDIVLYRGWMLTPEGYASLVSNFREQGAIEFTSTSHYRLCHYLPEWYPLLAQHTSDTVVLSSEANFSDLNKLQWPGYFIKDYVKSLNTGSGSLVENPEDIVPLIKLMLQYRGQIEGGICIRRREEYLEETEQRYFVLNGQAYGATDNVPALVHECARLIDNPFFSIDTIFRSDGVLRVVELGDGQVSDLKEWSSNRFAKMLSAAT